MMKRLLKNKKIFIFIAIITTGFFIYSGIWLYYKNQYLRIIDDSYFNIGGVYSKEINGYTYTIKPPLYPDMIGNFAIVDDSSGLAIIIWPKNIYNSDVEYGATVGQEKEAYSFYVDSSINFLNNKDNHKTYNETTQNKIEKLLESNKSDLLSMKKMLESELVGNKNFKLYILE